MPGSSNPWTKQEIRQLIDLWNDGVSAVLIGRKIGRTKNMVIGKSRRLKLDRRPNPVKAGSDPPVTKPQPQPAARRTRLIDIEGDRSLAGVYQQRRYASFVGLRFRLCQWIAGEPTGDDGCKCGKKTSNGGPWCPDHRSWVRQPRQQKSA